jgi:hypothetical protein
MMGRGPRKSIPGICEICGAEYMKKCINGKYCSVKCTSLAARRRAGIKARTKKVKLNFCAECGSEYNAHGNGAKFCSQKCYNNSRRQEKEISSEYICECGQKAVAKYKGEHLCDECLNPSPSAEYLAYQRQFYSGMRSSMSQIPVVKDDGHIRLSADEKKRMRKSHAQIAPYAAGFKFGKAAADGQ